MFHATGSVSLRAGSHHRQDLKQQVQAVRVWHVTIFRKISQATWGLARALGGRRDFGLGPPLSRLPTNSHPANPNSSSSNLVGAVPLENRLVRTVYRWSLHVSQLVTLAPRIFVLRMTATATTSIYVESAAPNQ